eukprot:scaffold10571_cov154-Cylindrotheca_fusiformis.AAC.18
MSSEFFFDAIEIDSFVILIPPTCPVFLDHPCKFWIIPFDRSPEMKYMIYFAFWHCSFAYVPEVNHGAIAGLWKLTQKHGPPESFPIKEFTVFPKDVQRHEGLSSICEEEMLLMLHEDGNFVQYEEDETNIPDKLNYHDDDDGTTFHKLLGKIKGKWDYVDGKLILAADRPSIRKIDGSLDTLLVGRVEARSQESLVENPVLKQDANGLESPKADSFDTHLSVPKGKVEVGRVSVAVKHC